MARIRPSGGYRELRSFKIATVIYDATYWFCERFVDPHSRTCDQMVQAARSGKQNILEGSLASATSKQSEIHLTNVARASLGELKEDYENFLRDRGLPKWDRTHRYARRVTELSRTPGEDYETYRKGIEHDHPEIAANVLRHLTMQATLLLDRQVARLEQDFLREGGIRERMTRARLEARWREEEWGART